MRAAVKAFLYTLKENAMSIPLLSIMLIFPIILIFILGNALSGYFKQANIPKMNIIIVEENLKPSIYDTVLKYDKTFLKLFNAEIFSSKSAALKKFSSSNKYVAVVTFKEHQRNNHSNYSPFGNFDIEISSKGGSQEAGFVKVYFNIFANYYKFARSIYSPSDIPKSINFESAFSGRFPRALDYYAVTMVVMMALYGSFGGIAVIEEERRQNTLIRLFSSPKSPYAIFIAKAFAQMVFLYVQLCIIVIFSKYIYHANWGNNLILVFLLLLVYSIFAILLGVFVALVAKNYIVSNVLVSSLAIVFTFLAGGYVRVDLGEGLLSTLREFLPNYAVQSAIFSVIYNPADINHFKNAITYLTLLCSVIFIICTLSIRKVKSWQFSG
ncbi:ABC-2 type transporter [Caldicellulosiruptor kronotskyensis 2002]|uniref:ABC-2 type transporter n=1 Tax=Caldicellulosiruptor kronotskyensis (strain DSM 18902 / VKM B-2412 / 2002) TaxID=632348 RepID=E4SHP3_CALK2|nr:ABC transporter permease [Caldicellulosiruptor kronotskyensis]ADQ47268.1 ABC-2 type transporter [Caldicellulosiruptor kronotskyensis 2002]